MRKNGFTLIELLAVIVILAIIALIATPIILGIINEAREESNERSVELYASAVRNGIAAYQLREGKEILPNTYTKDTLPFKVEYDGKVECTEIIISDDSKVSLKGCKVNGGEKTYNYGIEEETSSIAGTIGICNPLDVQTEGTYTAGDKYECDVDPNKEGYDHMFYVLTSATGGSVNLIMDSNITRTGTAIKDANPSDTGSVAWISWSYLKEYASQEDLDNYENLNIYGPISAMEHLAEATKDWKNVNPQTISTFTDDSGETHEMAQTFNVNARLPYYSEISSPPAWMLNYLEGAGKQTNIVSGVSGYWTLSSEATESVGAWILFCDGNLSGEYVHDSLGGVRPVINLSI